MLLTLRVLLWRVHTKIARRLSWCVRRRGCLLRLSNSRRWGGLTRCRLSTDLIVSMIFECTKSAQLLTAIFASVFGRSHLRCVSASSDITAACEGIGKAHKMRICLLDRFNL